MLAKGRYRFSGAGSRKVRLKVNRRGRKVLKKRVGRKGLVRLSSGSKKIVRIRR